MTWELQSNMHTYVLPSIMLAFHRGVPADRDTWLCERYADAKVPVCATDMDADAWTEAKEDAESLLTSSVALVAERVADMAIAAGNVTNGAHEVYLGDVDCHSVPWCSEEQMQAYHAGAPFPLTEEEVADRQIQALFGEVDRCPADDEWAGTWAHWYEGPPEYAPEGDRYDAYDGHEYRTAIGYSITGPEHAIPGWMLVRSFASSGETSCHCVAETKAADPLCQLCEGDGNIYVGIAWEALYRRVRESDEVLAADVTELADDVTGAGDAVTYYRPTTHELQALQVIANNYQIARVIADTYDEDSNTLQLDAPTVALALAKGGHDRVPMLSEDSALQRIVWCIGPEESEYTDDDVREMWRDDVYPLVVEKYGADDMPALRESFNNYTDALCKDGTIPEWQYENIDKPKECR